MIVEHNHNNKSKILFCNLDIGDSFWYVDGPYIKICPLQKLPFNMPSLRINCINLENGLHGSISEKATIFKVNKYKVVEID